MKEHQKIPWINIKDEKPFHEEIVLVWINLYVGASCARFSDDDNGRGFIEIISFTEVEVEWWARINNPEIEL